MNNQILKNFFLSTNHKAKTLKGIYKYILRQGPVSVEQIIDKTQTKPATCARLLDELVQNNLILADQLGQSTGGRRPILYKINPAVGYVIGIEITGIFSTILLMNIELSIIDKIKLKTPHSKIDDQLLDLIIANINHLLCKNSLTTDDVLGMGLSSDNLLKQVKQENTDISQDIGNILAYINQQIPIDITIGSGTNFAAVAERRLHYATDSMRFLFTRCDIEIHSSTIINGTIPLTEAQMTGAFGHISIDLNGPTCYCGEKGCLNQYCALPAIKYSITEQIKHGQESIISQWTESIDDIDYHTIFKALECNDKLAVSILEDAAHHYSIGLFNFILAFQPDTVVCGGTLVPKSSFFSVIKKNIEQKLTHYPQLTTQIYPASDSYDIVSQGAGAMVLEQFLT